MVTYNICKQIALDNNIKTSRGWYAFVKGRTVELNVPTRPQTYEEWISWSDFLNTNNIANNKKDFLSFKDAKILVHKLKLQSVLEWIGIDKAILNLPSLPCEYYKEEWISWKDWLNADIYEQDSLLDYDEAVKYLKKLKCKSQRDYIKIVQDHPSLPSNPYNSYKGIWKGWNEYLGTNNGSTNFITNNYLSYDEAKKYVMENNITSSSEYKDWFKINRGELGFIIDGKYLPSNPNSAYSKINEWENWNDFLETSEISYGEKQVKEYLDEHNIKFVTQKTFDGCVYKNRLRYDFYLPDNNILIEYDGKHHFEVKEAWGGEKEFKSVQARDKIKNDFANKNNIKLIRIPYYENVKAVLDNNIK